jgi:hypothetical protein
VAASGISSFQSLPGMLDSDNNVWHVLPAATFRVEQFVSTCAAGRFAVFAWPDTRERFNNRAVTRIYSAVIDPRRPPQSPGRGQPLLSSDIDTSGSRYAIMPQLGATPDGTIGCAFHEYEPLADGSGGRIEAVMATSEVAATFPASRRGRISARRLAGSGLLTNRIVLSDSPWDPAIDAPWAHGRPGDPPPHITFIGDYFGFDASESTFDTVWTDTRTGIQELFFQRVAAEERVTHIPDKMVDILFGVIQDGGGAERLPHGDVIIHVPPRGPVRELLAWYDIENSAKDLTNTRPIQTLARRAIRSLERSIEPDAKARRR